MSPMDYLETGEVTEKAPPVTGAGNNPSTWAGVIVLASLAGLVMMRRSFRRFM